MVRLLKAILLQKHWLNRNFAASVANDFFGGIGLIWLVLEVSTFFENQAFADKAKSFLPLYLVVVVIYTLIRNVPRSAYKFKINNRDSWVELRIGDILRCKGDIVVPFNDCFDASIGGRAVTAPTVQGELIRSRYNKDANKLQSDIDAALTGSSLVPQTSGVNRYNLGAVLPVSTPKGTAYLFASSKLQGNNRVRGDAADLARILPDLWTYIRSEGDKNVIHIPAIGTGHARTTLPREESVEEIVVSFIESCSTSTYCNKLVVVLHPDDVMENKINVPYLVRFIESYCEFTRFTR